MRSAVSMARIAISAAVALLLNGCQRDNSPIDFEVCMVKAESKSACKDMLSFNVRGETSMLPRTPYYPSAGDLEVFWMTLPVVPGVPSYHKDGRYDVKIIVGHETAQERFERYMAVPELPVNRNEGNLTILKESERGEAGSALLAPSDGDRSILFFCTKPYRATAGNLVENTGCTVRAELQRYVFIEYPIEYVSVHDWPVIQREVAAQVYQEMSINRLVKE